MNHYNAYRLTWWMDSGGCYYEVFDTLKEAMVKKQRVEDMGCIKWSVEGLP